MMIRKTIDIFFNDRGVLEVYGKKIKFFTQNQLFIVRETHKMLL